MAIGLRKSISGLGTLIYATATIADAASTTEVSTDGLGKVTVRSIVGLQSPHATDVFGVDETVGTDGLIEVPATGNITVNRSGVTGAKNIGVTMIGI